MLSFPSLPMLVCRQLVRDMLPSKDTAFFSRLGLGDFKRGEMWARAPNFCTKIWDMAPAPCGEKKTKIMKKENRVNYDLFLSTAVFSFVFISAHRILAGSEVLQGAAGGFQGGVFLGRAKETQVGKHRRWVAQPVHTGWRAFFGHLGHVKGKLGKDQKKMRWEEEPRLSFHDQQNLEQRWYLFLSLAALRAEATNGAFLPVEFRISLWLVLLETLGTFGLQLVGQVMEDAHTVFHRLMETKESNNNIIFLNRW